MPHYLKKQTSDMFSTAHSLFRFLLLLQIAPTAAIHKHPSLVHDSRVKKKEPQVRKKKRKKISNLTPHRLSANVAPQHTAAYITHMLSRSTLFKPILEVNPKFEKVFHFLISHDRHARFSFKDCFQYNLEDTRCVVRPGSHHAAAAGGGGSVTELLLFPFTVTMATTNVFGTLHGGMLMTMVDMCTSFHIAERLLPAMPGHVSVNLSTSFITAAKKDDRVIAVCRVDKLGKKLAYTSVDFLLDTHVAPRSAADAASPLVTPSATDDDVKRILSEYTIAAQGKHVKSIMTSVTLGHM
jgi:uncharacterized protein (TIGR00369 family)